MLGHVHSMLDCQGRLIHSGDFDGVADLYDIPLSLYVGEELLVYRSRPALVQGLQTITARYRDAGMLSLRWNIAAIELVRDRRFRLWVSWDHHFRDRIEERATEITYYCRLGPSRLHIEMVQYQAMVPALRAAQIDQAARAL